MKRIQVKNFRAIEDSGLVRLAPITVAVGRNSAGKSSFLRVFPLIKQTLERKTADPVLWYGDYVDFGDFRHTVRRNHGDKPITIAFETEIENARYVFDSEESIETKTGIVARVELSIKEKYCEKIRIIFFDQEIIILNSEKNLVSIQVNGDQIADESMGILAYNTTGAILPILLRPYNRTGENAYRELFFDDLLKKCARYIYGDTRPIDLEHMSKYNNIKINVGAKEKILSQCQRINNSRFINKTIKDKTFLKYNNILLALKLNEIIERINISVNNEMRQTKYVKPIRAVVDRYYRVQGISIDELDSDGTNLPMILKNMSSTQLREFEAWSKEKFGIVFSMEETEGHISLIIKENLEDESGTNVADTGYGYSQMLPIVMLLWLIHKGRRLYGSRSQNVVIEQPELHLHPAYQAKMVDVFVNVILEARKNGIDLKIFFETHSETMINRLGALVAYEKISKDDVNILIFEKDKEKSVVYEKSYNEDGILTGWPMDFFAPEET